MEIRAAQLVNFHSDADRFAVRHPARRHSCDRDRFPVAGHRSLRVRGDPSVGLRGRNGIHGVCWSGVRHCQSLRRHRPCHSGPARNRRMSTALDVLRKLLRDPAAAAGLLIILLLVLIAIFAPLLATHPEAVWDMNPRQRLLPPSDIYVFGTDRMGADIYSRILFGARITMVIASVAVGVALLIGVPIGLVSGWTKNWLGEALMRVSDIFLAVPQIVLAIAISQTLGPSIENVILALSVTYWPWFARVVYAETRGLQKEIFVESTAALGASPWRLTVLHVLPNIASPIIVRASIGMGFTILTAAALGFLGLGPPPPTPEWGRTIAESREFLPDAWWYATAPGLAIFLTVMGFNLLGDGLRDVLDPRLRRSRTGRDG